MGLSINGQDFTESYDAKSTEGIHLDIEYGDITIEYWDKDEFKLSGSCQVNSKDCEDALSIQSMTKNNTLMLNLAMDFEGIDESVTLYMKDGTKTTMSKEEYKKGYSDDNYKWKSMGYDVQLEMTLFLPKNSKLVSESLYGNTTITSSQAEEITIHNIYGSIDAILPYKKSSDMIDLRSTYSAVDLSLNEDINADLHMLTSYGEIYTNLNFEVNHQTPGSSSFGEDVKAVLNKGGKLIKLESNYGEIYLRKI